MYQKVALTYLNYEAKILTLNGSVITGLKCLKIYPKLVLEIYDECNQSKVWAFFRSKVLTLFSQFHRLNKYI